MENKKCDSIRNINFSNLMNSVEGGFTERIHTPNLQPKSVGRYTPMNISRNPSGG